MSRSIFWGLIMFISAARGMPPNPFQSHISPCEKLTEELTAWVLKGVISSSATSTALMLSPQATWKRVKPGHELFPDVQIENVGAGFVVARINAACKTTSYRWELKGSTYVMDANNTSDTGSATRRSGR